MWSDTHVKVYKKNSSFYDNHISPSFEFFYNECKKRNVDLIIHLGDFFHVKEKIATEAYTKAYKFVSKISALAKNIYLVGNHDSYMKDNHSIHLLESFKPLASIVDLKYEMFDINGYRFHFMPYVKEEEIKEGLLKINYLGNNKDFFFGHFGLHGFVMQQDNYTDQYSTINKNMFSKFKRAFFGHFHFHQEQANCMYISSPFESKHGDEQGKHGYVFYDTEKNEHEFIENPFSPKFKTIVLDKDSVKQILSSKNHFWRIYHPSGMNKEILNNLGKKLLETNYDVKFKALETNTNQSYKIPVVEEWQDIVHKETDDILLEWYILNKDTIPYSEEEMFAIFK